MTDTIKELFELRNDLKNYLEQHHKAEIMGAGISLSDFPVADISFKINGKEYSLTVEETEKYHGEEN